MNKKLLLIPFPVLLLGAISVYKISEKRAFENNKETPFFADPVNEMVLAISFEDLDSGLDFVVDPVGQIYL